MKKSTYTTHIQFVLVFIFFGLVVFFLHASLWNKDGSPEVRRHADTEEATPTTALYLHSDTSFEFTFPSDLKFSNLVGGEDQATTETVLFSSLEKNKGFQIFIAPYSSTAPLTIESIAANNKTMQIFDPGQVTINGEPGVIFLAGEKGSTATTREVWFTHQGKIYQISTYPDFEKTVLMILPTWKWLK